MPRGGPRSNKSRRQREVDGSRHRPRHDKHVDPEPQLGRPEKPAHLGPIATVKWDGLVAIMEGEQRLTVSDGPWLEVTALAYEEYRRWLELAQNSPLTTVDDKGNEKPHPAQQQARLAWESYRKLLAEGGITPISRARVNVGADGEEDEDEFTKLQKKSQQRPALRLA